MTAVLKQRESLRPDPTLIPWSEDLSLYDHLITEDDEPVDGLFSEKQQRLLTETLYTSWTNTPNGQSFVAMANVGLFDSLFQPPVVPDVLLSLGVKLPTDPHPKPNRSYFIWRYGKVPDVVIEIISNRKGQEAGRKMQHYAQLGIPYYIILDPARHLKSRVLRMYELHGGQYLELIGGWLPQVGIGLTLWHGTYETLATDWLRWCDRDGCLIPTGAELVAQERLKTAQAQLQAAQAQQRAERLAARLRQLGVNPEEED
jgi:Uma2 family endonuclease